ncbi:DNA/RNA non-specific endonuclease [Listeria sp. ILCC797]|uniref:DNA/RNA non-specific endonuclease n=1 Tax=Listeria sp. ILCC797 TaxID=1918333 RepID=UPI000B5964AB|nr:DNA/RNA non-specific endonuclease [Listeria sp. ILCC797]
MKKGLWLIPLLIVSILFVDKMGFIDMGGGEQAPPSAQGTTEESLTYHGEQVVVMHQNRVSFNKKELDSSQKPYQHFSELDQYNRVGEANAVLDYTLMPTAEREPLYVNPTGWKNKKIGSNEWLYNRCHLIGYQLTGENNNPKNLMTGTRSFNTPGMLTYENQVSDYIRKTHRKVRYQVKPDFRGNELVARGVQMQAKSLEDDQIEFNVYIFNIQNGVKIDYQTGYSKLAN